MLIKELKEAYPLVYEAAVNNINKNIGPGAYDEKNDIINYQDIENTDEGYEFWWAINVKEFDKAKEICPHLFEDKVPKRISYYIKYSSEFSEDLYNKTFQWCESNLLGDPRKHNESYEGLKKEKFFIIDNWGFHTSGNKPNNNTFQYGVDNNKQNCKNELDISGLKKLINYQSTVVKNKTQFNKGDYIVITRGNQRSFKTNYCFKQRMDGDYCMPELDIKGSSTNGLKGLTFSITSLYNWRYATDKEIAQYDKEGKPYNVTPDTESKQDFKVGDWILVTGNTTKGCTLKVGDVEKIVEIHQYFVTTERLSRNGGDIDFKNIRKALPSEIPVSNPVQDEVDMKEIQRQCKGKYPIGCKFKSLNGNEYTLKEDNVVYKIVDNNIWASKFQDLLYSDGDWAKLLKLPEDEESLLEKAKEKYPIGTTFYCPLLKKNYTVENNDQFRENVIKKGIIDITDGGCVYENGKWSEIVKESIPNYKGQVVHVDSQDKWDFVIKQERLTNLYTNTWKFHKENSCIFIKEKEYSRLDFYKENNYQIISFEEYLSLNLLEYEWNTFDELEVDYSNYFKEDEWYIVNIGNDWLVQFDRVENGKLYDKKCIVLDNLSKFNDSSSMTNIGNIKSARKATREEVEKYFPDEFKSNTKDYLSDVYRSNIPFVGSREYYKELYSTPLVPEQAYIEDEFMEPIKVKPYKKSKSKIKLIFNK